MTSKELFLQDKELRDKWHAVTHADWFQRILVFARSELMQGSVSAEQLAGAQQYERIMLDLPEDAPVNREPVTSGLHHQLDITKQIKPKK